MENIIQKFEDIKNNYLKKLKSLSKDIEELNMEYKTIEKEVVYIDNKLKNIDTNNYNQYEIEIKLSELSSFDDKLIFGTKFTLFEMIRKGILEKNKEFLSKKNLIKSGYDSFQARNLHYYLLEQQNSLYWE